MSNEYSVNWMDQQCGWMAQQQIITIPQPSSLPSSVDDNTHIFASNLAIQIAYDQAHFQNDFSLHPTVIPLISFML
jgi:hypothetical protein